MKIVKLKEVCDLQNGYAFKSSDYIEESNVLNCRMSNIRPNATFDIEYNPKYLPEEFADKYSDYLLNDGDLIIAMTDLANDPKILGVPTIVNTNGNKLLLNQRVGKLLVNASNIDRRYLKYALSLPQHKNYYKKFAGGGLQINIGKEQILNIEIPLISYENQIKVVKILEKSQQLVDKRKEQLEALDELVKSKFIEMFGKCEDTTATELQNACIKITDGTHQSPQFVNNGIPFLLVSNIVNNKINYSTEKFITREEYEKLIKRTPIELGDILLTSVGSYGNPAVVESTKEFCFQRHIAYIKPNNDIMNSYYLYGALQTPYVRNQIESKVKGIAQKTLNLSELKSIRINIPQMDRQNDFERFYKQADKLKFEMEKSLKEHEDNFNSLMQRAFKGELFN